MKPGIFVAPFHRAGENPALAQYDAPLIEHIEVRGCDEA